MPSEFKFQNYAQANADLLDVFGEDEESLKRHYEKHGRGELRGVQVDRYFQIENFFCSDQGDIFIAGWADRRIIQTLQLRMEVGYLSFDLDTDGVCWYARPDVDEVLGNQGAANGFIAILKIPAEDSFFVHSEVNLYLRNFKVHQDPASRWLSTGKFLDQALGACAVLAAHPIGDTLAIGAQLYDRIEPIWKTVLANQKFAKMVDTRGDADVDQSIIITIYRKPAMLLVQLTELADFLKEGSAEVIVVLNQVPDPVGLVNNVLAFCQIHDIRLSLYVCTGNSGFSGGNNHGAEVARGDTLIFMNPDVFPPAEDKEAALNFLKTDPGDALHGGLLYYGEGLLMHSGMYVVRETVMNSRSGETGNALRVEHFGKGLSHHIDDDEAGLDRALMNVRKDACIVSAALWKVRKDRFWALGGLPTDYIFAYYEDADFCLRWIAAGGDIVVDRDARWIHLEGVGKAMSPSVRSFMWLNRVHFSKKFESCDQVVDIVSDQALL
ncbi:glycosyltransferase [Parasphingopyxis sp.]|uniref:glycosyltransferase family 2 protein n=1 Tax=Parasphingopyxis sp. TaxID=1920299 RepID=UPI00261AC110|nr:glycosyltransferase [Parasphingopyxis sp.]